MALLNLFDFTSVSFLSAPATAVKCQAQLEKMLIESKSVEIDFSNVYVTLGFLSEFLEPLILKRGIGLFDNLYFANCSGDTENNINALLNYYREIELTTE